MHTTLPSCLYIFFIPVFFISQQSKKWSRSKQDWNWSYWTTCTPYATISTQSFGLSASTCYPTLLSLFLSKCTVGLWFHGITQKVLPKFENVFPKFENVFPTFENVFHKGGLIPGSFSILKKNVPNHYPEHFSPKQKMNGAKVKNGLRLSYI